MNDKTNEIVNKFMAQEFSQEITDDEAIEFIACHPDKRWATLLLISYGVTRKIVDSPYRALKICIKAYIDTVEKQNEN